MRAEGGEGGGVAERGAAVDGCGEEEAEERAHRRRGLYPGARITCARLARLLSEVVVGCVQAGPG
jgi:hypothetical protein